MYHNLTPSHKNVLHNSNNTFPKWYLETLGVYVSHLNRCSYCVDHHFEGLKRLINDEDRAGQIKICVESGDFSNMLDEKLNAGTYYAHKLTLSHQDMRESDVETLRNKGFDDGEILEINQVISYFNYVNRTVLGLGVNTKGDILGLSPNDSSDPDNWGHS